MKPWKNRMERIKYMHGNSLEGSPLRTFRDEDVDALIAAAEAVIQFCDMEPGYKGGALTEAAKKLMEEV